MEKSDINADRSAWDTWRRGGQVEPGAVSPEVLASWERCRRSGLAPLGQPRKVILSRDELARRRDANQLSIMAARGIFEKLLESIGDGCYQFCFADTDGYVLETIGSCIPADDSGRMQSGAAPGENWSESVMGTNAIGLAMSTGRAVCVQGAQHFFARLGHCSACACPIRDPQQRTIALLVLAGPVGEIDRHTAAMLAAAAKAVERDVELQRATELLSAQNRQLTLLNEVANLLNSTQGVESAFATIAERISQISGMSRVTLFALSDDGGELVGITSTVMPEETVGQIRIQMIDPDSVLAQAVREQRPIMFTGLSGPSMVSRIDGSRIYASMAFPVTVDHRVLGAFFVADHKQHVFTADEILAFHTIAGQFGVALERLRLYRSLTQESYKRAAMLDNVDVGVVIIDVAGGGFIWNRRMQEYFRLQEASREFDAARGLCPESLMRWPVRFINGDPETGIRRVIATGETLSEEAIVLADFPRIFRVTTAPVRDEVGKVRWVIRSYTDVTRYRELERAKSELIAMISHELRTPITSIRGYAELLSRFSQGGSLEQQHMLEGLCRETEELVGLVERVLAVNRLDLGVDRSGFREVGLNIVLDEVVKVLQLEARTRGVTIESCAAGDLRVFGDREGLKRVVMNLVHNAIKYSNPDGRVQVATDQTIDGVTITVRDQGTGIPKEHLDRIFERFYRVPAPETVGLPGSGLGLYIVKGVVEQHGGSVSVESELGQGTTFTVVLPGREVDSDGKGASTGG